MLNRYKIQQDKGRYCLKGCDDGDLVDYSAYAALAEQYASYREAAGAAIGADLNQQAIERIQQLEEAINLTLSGKAGYWPDVLRAALRGSAAIKGTEP